MRTLQKRVHSLLLLGIVVLGLGCASGNSRNNTNNSLANGRAALDQVATGQRAADTSTFEAILKEFEDALRKDPNSAEAHFGIAVCLAGQIGYEFDATTQTVLTRKPAEKARTRETNSLTTAPGDLPPVPPDHGVDIVPLPPRRTLALLWYLDRRLSNPYTLLNMLAPLSDLRLGLIPFYGYTNDVSDVTRRTRLLERLNSLLTHLHVIEGNPNFSTTVSTRDGRKVAVGLPEVYLFDAYVNSLRTELALSLAYHRDPGGVNVVPPPQPTPREDNIFPPAPPVFDNTFLQGQNALPLRGYNHLDLDKNGKLTPDEYLPKGNFLTLRDASLLRLAQTAMLRIVEKERLGIAGVLARPKGQVYLITNTDEIERILIETRDRVLPKIEQAAKGSFRLEFRRYYFDVLASSLGNNVDLPPAPPLGSGEIVYIRQPESETGIPVRIYLLTVNMTVWFNNPPADLKAFAPTYTLNSSGFPDDSKTVYPDPTFGGLYPDGLPREIIF